MILEVFCPIAIRDSIDKQRECPHTEVKVRIWGRKKKYKAIICKECHTLLSMEKLTKEFKESIGYG